jgi:ectoine hydroxylase-related dioxygenase (phytanoyl-CoA dioxygenase family)
MSSMRRDIDDLGFFVLSDVLSLSQCDGAIRAISSHCSDRPGSRNLMDSSWCRDLAVVLKRDARIASVLPDAGVAVQCTLFDKSPETNWLVAFHQDLSIPVRERVNSPQCVAWSVKEGVTFVQPSSWVLADLIAVRVHLDDCRLDNGPLRVIPGSHRYGRLGSAEARAHRSANGEIACVASRGAALLMRPLLLHASSKALANMPRRVLHVLFGPPVLPHGLQWRRAV